MSEAAHDQQERARLSRRLTYLLTRLNLSRAGAENLSAQQAYFEQLGNKIG